ncbi:FecR domain-containing protein [Sphingomonas sp. PP-CC-3G-468]|uniref:FecR family protein n=1 Tax=Sphingomonas sp. PP-CC-3G-468 TaxID=2135656 RepID=UPI00104BAF09|nr:FecR domain-containing protein [Sphingomonas sp. PP-CC-3G-468]TCM04764.1 FecR family protein [Sphingomonas sp. PP-CC-3G-468]
MTRFGGLISNDADVDAAEAATWLAQHRLGTLDEVAFEAWRDGNVAHAIAFARALAMWDSVDIDTSYDPSASAVPEASSIRSRRSFLRAACAVAAVGVVAAGATATRAYAWESETTALGESKTIRLSGGGSVALNTDSRLSWRVSDSQRTFWIERGEIALELPSGPDAVLHDDSSTVLLSAGRFNIRARGEALDILVQRGEARIAGRSGSAIDARSGAKSLLVSSDTVVGRSADADQVDRVTAWQHREILFRDATLGSAVEEYNRFLVRKIVIVDRELASIPVGGRFVTSDPTAFLNAVSTGLNIRVSRSATAYLLTR